MKYYSAITFLISLVFTVLFLPEMVHSENLLVWDATESEDITGYNIYYRFGRLGSRYDDEHFIDADSLAIYSVEDQRISCDIKELIEEIKSENPGLPDGTKYFFSVTAYNADYESPLSTEVATECKFILSIDINVRPFLIATISSITFLKDENNFVLIPEINLRNVTQQTGQLYQNDSRFNVIGTFNLGSIPYVYELEGKGNFSSNNTISGTAILNIDSKESPLTGNFYGIRVE